jgi:hypothetical protein
MLTATFLWGTVRTYTPRQMCGTRCTECTSLTFATARRHRFIIVALLLRWSRRRRGLWVLVVVTWAAAAALPAAVTGAGDRGRLTRGAGGRGAATAVVTTATGLVSLGNPDGGVTPCRGTRMNHVWTPDGGFIVVYLVFGTFMVLTLIYQRHVVLVDTRPLQKWTNGTTPKK